MKKVNLPDETLEKLIKNEYEMKVEDEEVTEGAEKVISADEIQSIEGVDEIPEGAEVVEGVTIEAPTEEEINDDFKMEEPEDEEVTEGAEYNEVDYASRGFKSLDDAILFMDTHYFKGLGEADKNEYRNWLIKK